MSDERLVLVSPDPAGLAQRAARFIADQAREAIGARGVFRIALSGGNTPRATYETLAAPPFRDEVDWPHVEVFFSDERFVPPESTESDFRMAQETLLSKVPLADGAVHRMQTVEFAPGEAAALYTRTIREAFRAGPTETPRFDVILLGLGTDGHTASLFPGTDALSDAGSLVAANYVQKLDSWRITFTYRLIDAARCVAFLVAGQDKAAIVNEVFSGADLPAARVDPTDGTLVWLLDEAAASRLPGDAQARRP